MPVTLDWARLVEIYPLGAFAIWTIGRALTWFLTKLFDLISGAVNRYLDLGQKFIDSVGANSGRCADAAEETHSIVREFRTQTTSEHLAITTAIDRFAREHAAIATRLADFPLPRGRAES